MTHPIGDATGFTIREKGIVRLSVHVSFDENLFPMLGADAENREPISFEDLQVVELVKGRGCTCS